MADKCKITQRIGLVRGHSMADMRKSPKGLGSYISIEWPIYNLFETLRLLACHSIEIHNIEIDRRNCYVTNLNATR